MNAPSSRSPRLDSVVAAYLMAVDAGAAPDPAAVVLENPDIADELRAFFADQSGVERLASPLRDQMDLGETIGVGPIETLAGTPPATIEAGQHIRYFGDYEIIDELGRGGMGIVFRATQTRLNRSVALKVIRGAGLASEDDRRRFQNEAEAVAQLDHPHIVPIIEIGEHDGEKYFSMKLIIGRGLDALPRDASPRDSARLVATAARAVHHAHLRGILHRDLKPSNILVDENGDPHITDFGLAKRVEAGAEITRSGAILGTPAYMAPEQAAGDARLVTTSADVYGLGAILYDRLAGVPPFKADSVLETLEAVRSREPEPIRPKNRAVDRDLETICLKCLQKEPARRYASADALADDLDRWLAGEPIVARPVSAIERSWKWARRHPAISGLAASLALAMVIGLAATTALYLRSESLRAFADRRAEGEKIAREQAVRATEEQARLLAEVSNAEAAAKRERDRAEESLYINQIALAYQHLMSGNVAKTESLLAECPPARRAWEWDYLTRLGHPEKFALPGRNLDVKSWTTDWNGLRKNVTESKTGLGVKFSISDDGKRLGNFCFGMAEAMQVWDLPRQKLVAKFGEKGRTPPLADMTYALSRDGKLVALADTSRAVRIVDASTGELVRNVGVLDSPVQSLDFSPDGKLLAAAGFDFYNETDLKHPGRPTKKAALTVWSVADGRVVFSRANVGLHASFSPDGRYLLSSEPINGLLTRGYTGSQLWKTSDWTPHRAIGPAASWSFSRKTPTLALAGETSGGPFLKVVDVDTGREIFAASPKNGGDVALSPDGATLAAVGDPRTTIDVWDVKTQSLVRTIRGHSANIIDLHWMPDGSSLVSSAGDGTIRFWDPTASQTSTRTPIPATIKAVDAAAIRADGDQAASVQGDTVPSLFRFDPGITLFDVRTGKLDAHIAGAHLQGARKVAYSSTGNILVSSGRDGKDGMVRVWDATTAKPLQSFACTRVTALAVGPDAGLIVTASDPIGRAGDPGAIDVWDGRTGEKRKRLNMGKLKSILSVHLAVSRDGRYLAACDYTTLALWDLTTWELVFTTQGLTSDGLAFSPDGSRLAVTSNAGVSILLVRGGKDAAFSHVMSGHTSGNPGGMAFTPDGRRLASARGAEVKLWDVATGREVMNLPRQPHPSTDRRRDEVAALAFSADGRRLVAVLRDGSTETWDATPPKPAVNLPGEPARQLSPHP